MRNSYFPQGDRPVHRASVQFKKTIRSPLLFIKSGFLCAGLRIVPYSFARRFLSDTADVGMVLWVAAVRMVVNGWILCGSTCCVQIILNVTMICCFRYCQVWGNNAKCHTQHQMEADMLRVARWLGGGRVSRPPDNAWLLHPLCCHNQMFWPTRTTSHTHVSKRTASGNLERMIRRYKSPSGMKFISCFPPFVRRWCFTTPLQCCLIALVVSL